jgi:hypothetical protein
VCAVAANYSDLLFAPNDSINMVKQRNNLGGNDSIYIYIHWPINKEEENLRKTTNYYKIHIAVVTGDCNNINRIGSGGEERVRFILIKA